MEKGRKIVFWTDSLRLHTIRIFEEAARRNEVVVAYCDETFRDIGKYIPENVELCHITDIASVNRLIDRTRSYIHINNAFKIAPKYHILKESLSLLKKNRVRTMSLFQEKYPYDGWKGFLRRIKWWWIYRYGLGRNHMAIGYAGDQAKRSLEYARVRGKRLFEFVYAPWFDYEPKNVALNEVPVFISVGQLVKRKAVIPMVKVLKSIPENFRCVIVGGGEQEKELRELIEGDSRFEYKGKLSQIDLQKEYNKADCLLLGSTFDGWGCVVNEALSQGCRVIVSDGCGASSLVLSADNIGKVFESGNWNELRQQLLEEIACCKSNRNNRAKIRKFAENLSPENLAEYLDRVLDSIESDKVMPIAPWRE